MENFPKKKNLIKNLTDDPNAGQGQIIKNALRSVSEIMEVAETVPAKNSTPETAVGEKKQFYRLVDKKDDEIKGKSCDIKSDGCDKVQKVTPPTTSSQMMQHIIQLDGTTPIPMNKTNVAFSIRNLQYFLDEKNGSIINKTISMTCHYFTQKGMINYDLNNIPIEKAFDVEIFNQMPEIDNCTQNKSELKGILYCYMNVLLGNYRGPRWSIYQRPGWKHNFHDYVTSDGAIAHPEQPVRADGKLHISDRYPGSIYHEYCQMLATIKEPGKMQAVLSYVLASFLHSVFEDAGFPVKHALFIVGPRGSKKTSVAQCFTQLGDDRRTVRFNFTATESGLQYNFQHYADQVMLIDDLAPSSDYTDRKRKEKMLESILRLCGDSGERVINTAFMKTGAEQIDYKVRGGIVITGEYFYGTGSESSIARAVVVKLKEESVENTLLSHFQNRDEIFESLIFRFLKFVGLNYNSTIALIRNTMQYYRNNASVYHFSNHYPQLSEVNHKLDFLL